VKPFATGSKVATYRSLKQSNFTAPLGIKTFPSKSYAEMGADTLQSGLRTLCASLQQIARTL
jgi:hypothetical protein